MCHGHFHVQFARLCNDVTSALRGSLSQPIRGNQKHRRVFVNISSRSENCQAPKCWRSVFDLATDVRDVSTNLIISRSPTENALATPNKGERMGEDLEKVKLNSLGR